MRASYDQTEDFFLAKGKSNAHASPLLTPYPVRATTSLDAHESNQHRHETARCAPPANSTPHARPIDRERLRSATSFRHGGWTPRRIQIAAALERLHGADKRLRRFEECGTQVAVFREKEHPDRYVLKGNYCRDRFCTPCQTARATTIKQNLRHHLRDRTVRMLTLTVHSTTEPLSDLVKHLYTSFSKLRRSKNWKSHVHGGVAFFELKFNDQVQRWHPHLHCLLEGRYYPHDLLRKQWNAITRTSFVIDIRPVRDAHRAVDYLTSYVTKGFKKQIANDPDRLQEAIVALRGTTTVFTFGAWRPIKLTQKPPENELEYVDTLTNVLLQAKHDDPTATAIVRQVFGADAPKTSRSPPSKNSKTKTHGY